MNIPNFQNINTQSPIDLGGDKDPFEGLLTKTQRNALVKKRPDLAPEKEREPTPEQRRDFDGDEPNQIPVGGALNRNPDLHRTRRQDDFGGKLDEVLDNVTVTQGEHHSKPMSDSHKGDVGEGVGGDLDEQLKEVFDQIDAEKEFSEMTPAERAFTLAYGNIEFELSFDESWVNGTGYFDHAVTDLCGLEIGDMATSVDQSGRRMIFVATRFGNIVFFERYTPNADTPFVLVANAPAEITALLPIGNGAIPVEVFEHAIDPNMGRNVGQVLEEVITSTNS